MLGGVTWTRHPRLPASAALGVLAAVLLALGTASARVQGSPRQDTRPTHARLTAAGLAAQPSASPAARTVVTFTWGGGLKDQMGALPLFRRYGIQATFYVPSGLVMQRFDGLDLSFLWQLNERADQPDLAVILQADPEVVARRLIASGRLAEGLAAYTGRLLACGGQRATGLQGNARRSWCQDARQFL